MRQLVINELMAKEQQEMATFLDKNAEAGALPGIYWLTLPTELLAEAQQGHEQCSPFVVGVELLDDSVSFELLVRSKKNLHCSCTSYATSEQRQFLLDFYDTMIEETNQKS